MNIDVEYNCEEDWQNSQIGLFSRNFLSMKHANVNRFPHIQIVLIQHPYASHFPFCPQ